MNAEYNENMDDSKEFEGDFNAQAARAKRPCPIWVDAFQRDTQHLETDEIGAYFLLLMAMWTREDCALPDDDKRLARLARVSDRLWKSRIGAIMREFFTAENGQLFSKRLRKEAGYVERTVASQSDRKRGKKSSNILKLLNGGKSADVSADQSTDQPTQQPNNLHIYTAAANARDAREGDPSYRERILISLGVGPSGVTGPTGRILGTPTDMAIAESWLSLPGMTEDRVIEVLEAYHRRGAKTPSSFKYFDGQMQDMSGALTRAPLEPSQPVAAFTPAPRVKFDLSRYEGK